MQTVIPDLNHYNEEVHWDELGKQCPFVILRATCGVGVDRRYAEFVRECEARSIPFHAYHYLKAMSEDEARAEAEVFYTATGKLPAPLFYVIDCEYEAITEAEKQMPGFARRVTEAFEDELKRLSGDIRVALYIGHNCYKKWALDYARYAYVWIPRYGADDGQPHTPPEYPCDLWQYTSNGRVDYVSDDVDLNQLTGTKPVEFFTGAMDMDEEEGSASIMESKFTGKPTGLQLAAWMRGLYAAGVVYWYGTCVYKCSKDLYTRKKEDYAKHYVSSRESGYMADIAAGRMCADCVGAIKGFFWMGGDMAAKNVYQSNNCPDLSADKLFALCEETGPISTIPDVPGIVVHKDGHIGAYIGGGKTAELRGFADDCVICETAQGKWDEWGKLPASMIDYVDGAGQTHAFRLGERELCRGDKGADVMELQQKLIILGCDLGDYGVNGDGADGEYGRKTEKAVKNIQAGAGIAETGVYDTRTHKALIELLNPPKPGTDDELPDGGGAPAYVLIISGGEDELRAIQQTHGGTLAAVDSVSVG